MNQKEILQRFRKETSLVWIIDLPQKHSQINFQVNQLGDNPLLYAYDKVAILNQYDSVKSLAHVTRIYYSFALRTAFLSNPAHLNLSSGLKPPIVEFTDISQLTLQKLSKILLSK